MSFAAATRRVLGLSDVRPVDAVSPATASGTSASSAGLTRARPRLAKAATHVLSSPLSTASLDPALAAAFGINTASDRVSRAEAMSVPAVRRARAIIAGTIGTFDWQALRGDEVVEDRRLMAQPDPNTTPQFIYTWTVDDLFFHGISWWHVTGRDARDYPLTAERVSRERVLVEYDNTRDVYAAYLDGRRVADNDLIRFDGPDEGILSTGGTTLRTALMLDSAVRRFARLDVPLGYLTPAEGAKNLSTEPGSAGLLLDDGTVDPRSEVDLFLDSWEDARTHRTTAYLNAATRYETVQLDARAIQLAEAKQEQAAEVARLCNLPPRYVNAPQASGMTYATTEGDRRELYDLTLRQYVTAIGQRLSMGDVTPAGQRVAPDVLSWLHGDTKEVLEAGAIGITNGVLTPEEVRTKWLKLPAGAPGLPDPGPPPT